MRDRRQPMRGPVGTRLAPGFKLRAGVPDEVDRCSDGSSPAGPE